MFISYPWRYHKKDHWNLINNHHGIDIKIIWELSRFDWLTVLARAYKVTNRSEYLQRLNFLLGDWCEKNPLNSGPNWICGQEAGIRIMKLITSAYILHQLHDPEEALLELVFIENQICLLYRNE